MIYISNYTKLNKIKETYPNVLLVNVCHPKPVFAANDTQIIDWGVFGPYTSLLQGYTSGKYTKEQFENLYQIYLDKIWNSTSFMMGQLSNRDAIFLTYDNDAFPSRHILMKFFTAHGFPSKELNI
jgi:hypothetical protein